jgi:aerobic carbon-monoxide dehydrogenase medium subunit
MYPTEIDYHRASSIAEAIALLSQNDDAKLLAGGHSLLPAMKLRLAQPGLLIDISHLEELKAIFVNRGGKLSVGALATHAQIAASADVQSCCSALASATGMVGDQQVRNWGTIGGNLAHADPASDPPTVVLAYDGVIHIQGTGGSRTVNAQDFFTDLFTTALEPGEIITSIELPNMSSAKSAYVKLSHPASRYAVVGVCAVLEMNGSTCTSAHVAVGGATTRAVRSPGAESALAGSSLDDGTLNAAAAAVKSDIEGFLIGDMSYPEDYRQAMAGVYLKRAVHAALGS